LRFDEFVGDGEKVPAIATHGSLREGRARTLGLHALVDDRGAGGCGLRLALDGFEYLDGALAAVAPLLADLVNQKGMAFLAPIRIPLPQSRQHFFGNLSTHRHSSGLSMSSFLSQRPSSATPR